MAWSIVYQSPSVPTLISQGVTAQNEGSGTQNTTATITGVSTAGVLLVGIAGVLTAQFAGPLTLNNSNTFGSPIVNEVYSPTFNGYSIRVWALSSALGGSAHATTMTKTTPFTAEGTVALIALSGGSVISQPAVVRNANGAGATLTSSSFTVGSGKRALCIAIWSGTGNVNATPPTATMVDSGSTTAAQWGTPIIAIARGTGTAPDGHIPLFVWTATLSPGTYTWAAQPAINEGAIMATLVCQV